MTIKLLNPENAHSRHKYEIEANEAGTTMNHATVVTVAVYAQNRTQAASVARRHGYMVRSVNMVG